MRIVFAIIELSLPPPRLPADWMMRREEGEGSAKRLAIKGINNGSVFGFAPGATQQPRRVSGEQKAALSLDKAPLCGSAPLSV